MHIVVNMNKSDKDQEVTEGNLVDKAISTYRGNAYVAYKKYTTNMVNLINSHYPLDDDNFKTFHEAAKTLRAQLSQGVGAASKTGKGVVIMFYAKRLSEADDLSMSVREADAVIKSAAGRSVAKSSLSGMFGNRNGDGRYSPFFSNDEEGKQYKERVLSHPLVAALSGKVADFDTNKPKLHNPYQKDIDDAIASYGEAPAKDSDEES